jgi:excisionase family DNA binding protein
LFWSAFTGTLKAEFRLRCDDMDVKKKISAAELASLFADPQWSARFPPVLTVQQAADLLQVPKQTLYGWSSQGLLDDCKAKAGKHLRLVRDRLLQKVFIEGLHEPR